MDNTFFKVITASAGTGKTYRLSLEYIRILIEYSKYDEFHYSQILAITFTRKATAEIKERIYQHLQLIYTNNKEAEILIANLENLLGRTISRDEIQSLKEIYLEMLLHKQDVHISTIDSFAGSIFNSVIAPWKGINEYEIDLNYNEEILPEILENLLRKGLITDEILAFLNNDLRIRPELHTRDLDNLITHRWQVHFLEKYDNTMSVENFKQAYLNYHDLVNNLMELILELHALKGKAGLESYIKPAIRQEFNSFSPLELPQIILSNFTDLDYLKENYRFVMKNITIYDGRRLRDKDLKALAQEVQTALADLLYYHVYLNEWIEIKNFWTNLLAEYDEMKLTSGKLTYSDITDYTFNYLYDKDISIVDANTGTVTNRFYEALSYRTRFLLFDEFQDTSIVQFKLFQPMIDEMISGSGTFPYGGVIIVGDEKQAIYQWRSGEMELINKLENIYDVQYSRLETCYRSSKSVIDFINEMFSSPSLNLVKDEMGIDWNYEDVMCARKNAHGSVAFKEYGYTTSSGSLQESFEQFVNEYLIPHIRVGNDYNCEGVAVIARTNRELTAIADLLTQSGISFIQESNNSLFKHHAITPILHLMDWIAYGDRLSLLKFFRSDLYMLPSDIMKEFLQNSHKLSDEKFNEYLNDLSAMDKIQALSEHQSNPFIFAIKVIEAFNFESIFKTDNEKKNLDKFLNIVHSFTTERHDYTNNLAGFLQYCIELEKEESNRQETVNNDNAITLISIHKSKGLAFKTVFFYSSVGTGIRHGSDLFVNYRFDDKYIGLTDYDISMRCREILKLTSKTDTIIRKELSEEIQELNAIYVAMTRAEDNLYLFYAVKQLKGGEPGADFRISKVIYSCAKHLLNNTEVVKNEFTKKIKEITHTKNQTNISHYFSPDKTELFEELKPENIMSKEELTALYITGKRNVIGSVVHHYLSFIEYNHKNDHEIALKQTISAYGNLIPYNELLSYVEVARRFVDTSPEVFSDKWDHVFNEYTIYHPQTEQEFRIDRLQISESEKLIVIVDYKTGSIKDEAQLDNYKEIISSLPHVRNGGYRIETEYIKIHTT